MKRLEEVCRVEHNNNKDVMDIKFYRSLSAEHRTLKSKMDKLIGTPKNIKELLSNSFKKIMALPNLQETKN